jgi:hypothetical protein
MPAPHSTDNYVIGKGIMYIGEWSGSTPPVYPGGYNEMGNCPSIEVEPSVERLPHYSSRAKFRTKDKNPVIESNYMVNIECDEMAAVNVSRYLMGTLEPNVKGGGTIHAMTRPDQEFGLVFVSDNPVGPNSTWKFWRGTIMPNGALQLIGDEWIAMAYQFEGLSDSANHSTSEFYDVEYATTTSTSTTTTIP